MALLGILMALPGLLHGQKTRQLEVEVRRLEHEVELARQEEDSLRAVREAREMSRFIRIRSGGLELVTLPQLRERVEAAGRQAWEVLQQMYQDSVAVSLHAFPLSVLARPPEDSLARQVWYPAGTRLVFAMANDDTRGLATNILAQVTQELWLRQDQDLRDWMKSPPPVTTDLGNAFSNAYLDLATSASPIAQRCLENAGECLTAMGLERPADPAAEWYSPEGRRRLVQHLSQFLQVGDSRESYDACLAGVDESCLELLRMVPNLIPGTLLPSTRFSLLRFALEKGGPGSYPVLLGSSGEPMKVRFQTASGGDIDRTIGEWHRQVVSARPRPTTVYGGQTVAAAGWSVLFLLVALRSSRWR